MKTVDMADDMEKVAIETATYALNEYNTEKEMASHVKKEFDKQFRCVEQLSIECCNCSGSRLFSVLCCSPTWHVVVGTNYGSHVVHATKHFIYFYLGPKAFLIFKSG